MITRGQIGLLPAKPTPYGLRSFERSSEEQGEANKTGKLEENRRFFAKLRSGWGPAKTTGFVGIRRSKEAGGVFIK